jgi:regulator of sigma E protease
VLTYVVSFVLMLGVIIFVHEFGHFITAKLFGMRVFIFSFGFGKRLFGFTWGETDLRVSLVPLGGYVKLEGEPEDYLSENVAVEGDPRDNPNYFTSRPRWQRFLVYLAGPFMNAALTIAVLTVFNMRGLGVDTAAEDPPVIGYVEPQSPAEAAGLVPGDRVVSVAGEATPTWEAVQYNVVLRPNAKYTVQVQRAGQAREVPVQAGAEGDGGKLGVSPLVRIGSVTSGSPAEQAGLRKGDGILSMGGKPLRSFNDIPDLVKASGGQPLRIQLYREGGVQEVSVTPRDDGGTLRLGIGNTIVMRKLGFLGALREGVVATAQLTVTTLDVMKRLVTAQLSPRTIMGPLGIARASGEAARAGPGQWFFLMAAISLQVGILNLFPLAPLDGGHLAILLGESVVRHDLSPNAKAWIINAGALVLFALIGLVLYSDIAKTGWLQRVVR